VDKLKQWIAFALLGVLVVLAAGWLLVISPKRKDAADIDAQTAAQDTANASLQTSLKVLKEQARNEPAQEAKLAAVAAKIPDNPALPTLIRTLDRAGASTGVELVTLSPGVPVSVAVAAAPAVPVVPVAGAARTAVTRVGPAAAASAGSLTSIPVALTITGSYFQAVEFVDELETLTRAFKVSGLSIAKAVTDSPTGKTSTDQLGFTVTGTIYMAAGRAPLTTVSIPKTGK
jgi:Tfp pilus assembly protein PilO